ncbi:MAG: ATP-binding cassette domain-containing protein [Nitrososphaerales archaeon]
MIDVRVKKRLGEFLLSSELHDSGFICLTGRNGAGKSSFLNVISGVLVPDEGYVRLNSLDITKTPIEKRGIVLVTPDSYIPHLEVSKHLEWGARIRAASIDENFVQKVKKDLDVTFEGKLKNLSLGMRERVALATALISRPKVILIDETFSNIDNHENFISSYRSLASGIDVIFTSQRPDDKILAEHQYVMEAGVVQKVL